MLFGGPALAATPKVDAVVIASFGTSYPEALRSILAVEDAVKKAFPGIEVRQAFTSSMIRKKWHRRAKDAAFKKANPEIPAHLYSVKSALAQLADLSDAGYRNIVIQPTHIYAGEEYGDLAEVVNGLSSIDSGKAKWKPFENLFLGRPALGRPGSDFEYLEDIEKAAEALEADAKQAKKEKSALVYMGHGNEHFSTGAYAEFQKGMRAHYPEVKTYVGTVEGFPSAEDVFSGLLHAGVKKVLLKPFMLVAGDHARNDMAGSEEDSWKSELEARGIEVVVNLEGLGETPEWAAIYAKHAKDAVK